MGRQGWQRVRRVLDRLYPERQFYYRSRGVVRFIALGKPSQMALSGFVLAVTGWLVFATVHVVLNDQIIEAKDRRIAEISAAYQVLADRTVAGEERLLAITGEVEAQHKQLLELVEYA